MPFYLYVAADKKEAKWQMWLDLQKPIQIVQKLKSILSLNIKLCLLRNTIHMAIDGQVCFHRWSFAVPVEPTRCTTGSLGPVSGINKDVSGVRLLPMTVSTYRMDWVCFCHLLNTQQCCLYLDGRYNLSLATHPPAPTAHPIPSYPPTPITCHLWYYSCCENLLKIQQC